jgi:phosphoglycerate dehydrogenase-like enzyme
MPNPSLVNVAILDDYQNVALSIADWSPLSGRANLTVFNDHLSSDAQVIDRLTPFNVVCVMRERTPLTRRIIESLPNLKLITSTGPVNHSIDTDAAAECGVTVVHTGYSSTATIEFAWAMILAIARNIHIENQSVREGGWQVTLGTELAGKTLGLLGHGNVGSAVSAIGRAFGMNVIAWSENLTVSHAEANGARLVDKETLFSDADFLSIHVRLSERTRGLVGTSEFARMKASSRIINTSRGPIVDTAALLAALDEGSIAGAAVDVCDVEPLELTDPLRTHGRVLATPHIGYVTRELYQTFYDDSVSNIVEWLDQSGHTVTSL